MDPIKLLHLNLAEYREQLKDFLASGAVKDYEGYQRIVGRIEAFSTISADIEDILARHEES